MLFDPSAGNASFLIAAAILAEVSFSIADTAAEQGDDTTADELWQTGAQFASLIH